MRRLLLLTFVALAGSTIAGCGQHDLGSIAPSEDAWFQEQVAKQDLPVLVDFGATWCGPCKELEPHLDKLKEEYAGKLKVVKIDVDQHSDLAAHYGVEGIPALFIFKNGRVTADSVGSMSYLDLEKWATTHLP
jgi:thioredoxin 1